MWHVLDNQGAIDLELSLGVRSPGLRSKTLPSFTCPALSSKCGSLAGFEWIQAVLERASALSVILRCYSKWNLGTWVASLGTVKPAWFWGCSCTMATHLESISRWNSTRGLHHRQFGTFNLRSQVGQLLWRLSAEWCFRPGDVFYLFFASRKHFAVLGRVESECPTARPVGNLPAARARKLSNWQSWVESTWVLPRWQQKRIQSFKL